MDNLKKEDIEELAKVKGDLCVSLYIPTHKKGHEVNNGKDTLLLKTELQKARNQLLDEGHDKTYIKELLQPAFDLIDDSTFWSHQEEGLALFISSDFFRCFRLPVSFDSRLVMAEEFILTPLLEVLNGNGKFFILTLSHKSIHMFEASRYSIRELELPEDIPQEYSEITSRYDFEEHLQGRAMNPSPVGGGTVTINRHGHGHGEVKEPEYLRKFFRMVDEGIKEIIRPTGAPLVLAGVDYLLPVYNLINSYNELEDEGIYGNFDTPDVKKLHEKGWEIVQDTFMKPIKEQIEKYNKVAGTGKTSYELKEIYKAAQEGRVETVFVEKGYNAWANVKENNEVEIHDKKQEKDIDVVNDTAVSTLLNSGDAILVDKEQIPEKHTDAHVVATFRY